MNEAKLFVNYMCSKLTQAMLKEPNKNKAHSIKNTIFFLRGIYREWEGRQTMENEQLDFESLEKPKEPEPEIKEDEEKEDGVSEFDTTIQK